MNNMQVTEPIATRAPEPDWSGWENWLRSHLDIEREIMTEAFGEALGTVGHELGDRIGALELKVAELTGAIDILRGTPAPPERDTRALGELLSTERQEFRDLLERRTKEFELKLAELTGAIDILRGTTPPPERDTRALGELLSTERRKYRDLLERRTRGFELKLAELTGAIDVLRGKEPPPHAQFPSVKAWQEDVVHHEGDIVAFAGGTWQAQRDTARVPGAQDWICLAAAGCDGKTIDVRGTFNETAEYHRLDVVALNGSSFVALKDAPGLCPGSGWQPLASQGNCGPAGKKGERGAQGPQGTPGLSGATIRDWKIDREKYVATPLISDGRGGPPLELLGLFQQFFADVQK
jgi:uncharacterized membrane protein